MKKLIALALATSLGGCANLNLGAFIQNWQDVESQVLDVVSRVKSKVDVINADIDFAIRSTCGALPGVSGGIQSVISAVPNPGPKTRNAITVAQTSLNAATAACSGYIASPTAPTATLLKLWAAYNSAKNAVIAANNAAGA